MAQFPVPCPITASQALICLESLKENIFLDRNEALIERLYRSSPGGFSYSDVPHLHGILRVTQQRLYYGTSSGLATALCNLISHLRQPLVKQRASDELHFEGDVAALLGLLAEMLLSGNPELTRLYACKALLSMLTRFVSTAIIGGGEEEDPSKVLAVKRRLRLLQEKGFIAILMQGFESNLKGRSAHRDEMTACLIHIFLALSQQQPMAAALVSAGAISLISRHLGSAQINHITTGPSLQLLTTLLDSFPSSSPLPQHSSAGVHTSTEPTGTPCDVAHVGSNAEGDDLNLQVCGLPSGGTEGDVFQQGDAASVKPDLVITACDKVTDAASQGCQDDGKIVKGYVTCGAEPCDSDLEKNDDCDVQQCGHFGSAERTSAEERDDSETRGTVGEGAYPESTEGSRADYGDRSEAHAAVGEISGPQRDETLGAGPDDAEMDMGGVIGNEMCSADAHAAAGDMPGPDAVGASMSLCASEEIITLNREGAESGIHDIAEPQEGNGNPSGACVHAIHSKDQLGPAGGTEGNGIHMEVTVGEESVETLLARVLSTLLREGLENGYARDIKGLRNRVVSTACHFALHDGAGQGLWEQGFVSLAMDVATFPEVNARPAVDLRYCSVRHTMEDFELRLLAWKLLGKLGEHPEVVTAMKEAELFRVLLMYVDPDQQSAQHISRWSPPQLPRLREAALDLLKALVPLIPDTFEAYDGSNKLVACLRHATSNEDTPIVQSAVSLLAELSGLSGLREALGLAGVIEAIVDLLSDAGVVSRAGNPNDINPDYIKERAATALVLLTSGSGEAANQRRLRDAGGISTLLFELGRLRGADPSAPSPVMAAIVAAVHAAVAPSHRSRAQFLAGGGAAALLDLLDACHKQLRPLLLTTHSDLCVVPTAQTLLLDWRAPSDKSTIVKLALRLWREVEGRRGMTEADGLLANLENPLEGTGQRTDWRPDGPCVYPCQIRIAFAADSREYDDSILAKVFSLLTALGFPTLHSLESDSANAMTLATVEAYPAFKAGEAWRAVLAHFQARGVLPTKEDQAKLEERIAEAQDAAAGVRAKQTEILERVRSLERAGEAAVYRDAAFQREQELAHRRYKRDTFQLTLKERLAARARKEMMLRRSFCPELDQSQPAEAAVC